MDENQRNVRVEEELLLAEQAHKNGEFETALAHCLKAIKANPVSVPAYQSAGRICMLLERLKEAEGYFQKVLELDGSQGSQHFDLGNVYFGCGQYTQALSCYAKAESLGCKPEVLQKIYYLAGLLQQAEMKNARRVSTRTDAARAALINFQKAGQVPGLDEERADILLRQTQIYVETGDFTNARHCAEALKLLLPNQFKSYQILFQIDLQRRDLVRAKAILAEAERVFAQNPEHEVDVAFDRVLLHCYQAETDQTRRREHYANALQCLRELTCRQEPETRCEAAISAAEIHMKLDAQEEAQKLLEGVLQQTARDGESLPEEYTERARFLLLEIAMVQKRYGDALPFARALQESARPLYRHHGLYTEALATKQLCGGDSANPRVAALYEKAIAYYRNHLVSNPGDVIVIAYRVKSYADLGQFDRAETLCGTVAEDVRKPLLNYIWEQRRRGE